MGSPIKHHPHKVKRFYLKLGEPVLPLSCIRRWASSG